MAGADVAAPDIVIANADDAVQVHVEVVADLDLRGSGEGEKQKKSPEGGERA